MPQDYPLNQEELLRNLQEAQAKIIQLEKQLELTLVHEEIAPLPLFQEHFSQETLLAPKETQLAQWALPVSGAMDTILRTEKRYALAMRAVNDGVWEWDLRSGEVYYSPRCKEILGYTSEEMGTALHELWGRLHYMDAQEVISAMTRLSDGQRDRLEVQARMRKKDGAWIWVLIRAVSSKDGVPGKVTRITGVMADLATQNSSDNAMRASGEKFRALVENSPDLIIRFDKHYRPLYISPGISRYIPLLPEDIIGENLRNFPELEQENLEFWHEHISQVFEMALSLQSEVRLQTPLRGSITCDCRFWPEFDGQGKVLAVVCQIRDITIQHRMQQSYQALFSSMIDGFSLYERTLGQQNRDDFVLLALNTSFASMHNIMASDSIVGHRLDALFDDEAPIWRAVLTQVVQTEEPVMFSLFSTRLQRYLEITLYSPEENKVACIARDVTKARDIELKMGLTEARFAALYRLGQMDDASEDVLIDFALEQAVSLTGSSVGFLYLSPKYTIHDATPVYWVDASSDGAIPPPEADALQAYIDDNINGRPTICNDVQQEELLIPVARNISRRILTPILREGHVIGLAGVANKGNKYNEADLRQLELFMQGTLSVLHRRWAMLSLKKAKDAAEAANRAKDEFLANVSHELRTPLNGILGMLQLLELTPLTAKQRECVLTASTSGKSLLRVISDILDFSRIEAGRFEMHHSPFDLTAVVREVANIFTYEAAQRELKIIVDITPNLPPMLLGDDARVRQILFNILGNAIKFTERGGIKVSCSLLPFHNTTNTDQAQVYFCIQDTGVGLPDDRLDDIFQAFTQLDGSSTRRYAGTGLGLGIVRRLITLMHGALCVESTLGKGTAIHISLPFTKTDAAQSKPVVVASNKSPFRKLRILVAEDDIVNQFAIRSLLQHAGHLANCVANGALALERLKLEKYDCLFTDIQMPIMDGIELISTIRHPANAASLPRTIPIVVLTAHAMSGDRERFMKMDIDAYLSKPIIVSELTAVLTEMAQKVVATQQA